MKAVTLIGIILIALGVVGLIYGGITYTSTKNVVDLGPIELKVDEKKEIPLPPILGAVAVVIGTTLILVGRRRSAHGASI